MLRVDHLSLNCTTMHQLMHCTATSPLLSYLCTTRHTYIHKRAFSRDGTMLYIYLELVRSYSDEMMETNQSS